MVGEWPKLAYETPVLGPPWSIPFEFPLYQWIVAALVTVTHLSLDPTARLVSIGFFLLTLIPANRILRSLDVSRQARLISLSMFLISPFYIFWSRTCMIESTALFLGMSYLALAMQYARATALSRAIAAMGVGALAMCVKVTTFAPFLLASVIFQASLLPFPRSVAALGGFVGVLARRTTSVALVPLIFGVCWTHFADETKKQNSIAVSLTSTNLTRHNFGTIEQRESIEVWETILGRVKEGAGSFWILSVALVGLMLSRRRERR